MTDQDSVDRINALTRNARSTWFALLAALVFVGVTLMSVEHIDFYGVGRATQLPLVNVQVPTRYFFVAAPILITAMYGYFHLYLIRLWDALGAARPRLNGMRLGDAVTPWLVTDAALHMRRRMRRDNATTPRLLEGGAMGLNFILAWGFGPVVLYFLWRLSMPAREFWMTAIAATALVIAILTGLSSLAMLFYRMGHRQEDDPPMRRGATLQIVSLVIGGAAVFWHSYQKTEGPADQLAALNLVFENIVERPPGWLTYPDARAEFRATWCRREQEGKGCTDFGDRETEFADEFSRRRRSALAELPRPDWDRRQKRGMDFRNAQLRDSFLSAAFLRGAQMEGANLGRAQMEGVVFDFSQLTGTPERMNLLQNTNLSMSTNNGGMLRFVDLTTATFDGQTDFRNAFLDGSVDMSPAFRAQMDAPCQWAEEVLDDEEFYGRWRGWVDANPNPGLFETWRPVGTDEYLDVTPIPPPPGCTWKTDPITAAGGE